MTGKCKACHQHPPLPLPPGRLPHLSHKGSSQSYDKSSALYCDPAGSIMLAGKTRRGGAPRVHQTVALAC